MKITRRQLRRIIREYGRSEHDAEARGMVASYRQGYSDAYRGPRFKRRGGDPEYRRGYENGVADVEQGKPPPDDLRPARRIREAEGSTKKYDEDHPGNPTSDVEKEEAEETNEAGDAYFVMVDDLVTSLGQNASKVNGTEDEVYIMTGQEEGITVKVVRRGR